VSQPKSLATFRENPNRAIYILEDINEELVAKLAPSIIKLRNENTEPITVYLHSRGGLPRWGDQILSLLRAPDQNGNSREITTVAIGRVASAAADLLAQGDYAISYEGASVNYHGVAISQDPDQRLTYESASLLASNMQSRNEQFARNLARTIFDRFTFVMMRLDAFQEFRDTNGANFSKLIRELQSKTSPKLRKLFRSSLTKTLDVFQIMAAVVRQFAKSKSKKFLVREKIMLRVIIDRKAKWHRDRNEKWELGEGGIEEVVNDFKLFTDFLFGDHNVDRNEAQLGLSNLLLSDAERHEHEEFCRTETDTAKQNTWVTDKVEFRALQLWYFLVSCCRMLQTDDFVFTPTDAYWMGLVHEVAGSELPCLREMLENPPTTGHQPSA
jgi:ATP-dependent protease ClpP protease subunit